MQTRLCVLFVSCCYSLGWLHAQNAAPNATPGIFTDPKTGITYRQEVRTYQRPVVENKVETREVKSYQPELVTTTQTESRTYYTPSVHYAWQPKWHGWWNPFKQPTLAYHQVPVTTWQPRVENVQLPQTTTRWVEKTQQVQVPTTVTRWEETREVVNVPVTIPPNQFRAIQGTVPNFAPINPNQIATGREQYQRGMPATVLGNSSNPAIIATSPRATIYR